MALYIDQITRFPIKAMGETNARGQAPMCHLWADTPEQLHKVALFAGLPNMWHKKTKKAEWYYITQPVMNYLKHIKNFELQETAFETWKLEQEKRVK